jgi:D-alanine-D-alanine ligase
VQALTIALAYDGRLQGETGVIPIHDAIWETVNGIRNILEERGHRVVHLPIRAPIAGLGRRIRDLGPDLVFNLAESIEGSSVAEWEVAQEIERSGVPFTGCPSQALCVCLDKAKARELLSGCGLPVPPGCVMGTPDDPIDLRLPAIVKCSCEDASLGLDDGAVVTTEPELRARVAWILTEFHQPAIVEEFLDGREFNLAVVGSDPVVLPVSEIDFSTMPSEKPRFVSYSAKWAPESTEYRSTVPICPAHISEALAQSLRRMALEAFQLTGCRDYARVDIRMDREEQPYILEINPNPDLSVDAGLARSVRAHGWRYNDFIEYLTIWASEEKNRGIPDDRLAG